MWATDGIHVALQLREFDRCRTLYEKYLEHNPANVYAWIKYAELEKLLEEVRDALGGPPSPDGPRLGAEHVDAGEWGMTGGSLPRRV